MILSEWRVFRAIRIWREIYLRTGREKKDGFLVYAEYRLSLSKSV